MERVREKQKDLGLTINQTLVVLVGQGLEPRLLIQVQGCQPAAPVELGPVG